MTQSFLSIGGNLGDRVSNLRQAVEALDAMEGIRVQEASSLYETSPVGVSGQPDYLNAVLRIETERDPDGLLEACHAVENRLGRERTVRWGARTADIDILTFGDVRSDRPELLLPHPRMGERDFVQIPLRELRDGHIEWTGDVRPFAFAWCLYTTRTPRWLHRATTGSTNDDIRQLAAVGLPAESVVVADRQTAGRGRMGRVWQSREGIGVWMSILFRPSGTDARLGGLVPLAAGLAVARTLRAMGVEAWLKWPNDVLCRGRKICGILCESIASGTRLEQVTVGIGLNLFHTREDFGSELAGTATSLVLEKPELSGATRDAIASGLLSETVKTVRMVDTEKDALLEEYRVLSWLIGRTVRAKRPSGAGDGIQGTVTGISAVGALILQTAQGPIELESGEVTLHPAGGIPS